MSLFVRRQPKDAVVDKSFFKAKDLPAIERLEEVLRLERRQAWLIGAATKGNRQYKEIELLVSPLNPVSGSRRDDYDSLCTTLQKNFDIEQSEYRVNIRNKSTELVVSLAPPYFTF